MFPCCKNLETAVPRFVGWLKFEFCTCALTTPPVPDPIPGSRVDSVRAQLANMEESKTESSGCNVSVTVNNGSSTNVKRIGGGQQLVTITPLPPGYRPPLAVSNPSFAVSQVRCNHCTTSPHSDNDSFLSAATYTHYWSTWATSRW